MSATAARSNVHNLHSARNEDEYEDRYIWDKERGEAARPFRLWDSVNRVNLRWRYYGDKKRAHMAALIEARWLPIGSTIEVYDCRTGRFFGKCPL